MLKKKHPNTNKNQLKTLIVLMMKKKIRYKKAEKQIAGRRIKAEEIKTKKCKEKIEENKIKESEMWDRLNELNSEFKKIKTSKNEPKKLKPQQLFCNKTDYFSFYL